MPQNDIEESLSESQPGHATSPKIDPQAHILSVQLPNYEERSENREKNQLDQDTHFPQNDAIIIVEGFESIQKVMDDYTSNIKEYNEKLKENGCNYRIKAIHQHKYRQYNYYYFGNYIYELKEPLSDEIITHTLTDSSLAKKTTKKKKKTTKKAKKRMENGNNKTWQYVEKFSHRLWHEIVEKDILAEIGLPPKMNFQNIAFHVVHKGSEKTNTIIMPYLIYMNNNVKPIFKDCAAYRLYY